MTSDSHLASASPARRVLFVNENIGGHRTMHMHLAACLNQDERVAATFVDVAPAGLPRKIVGAQIPGLARRDLDLQPLRYQLAQSAVVRRILAHRARDFDVLHLYSHNIALLSASLLRRQPSIVSTDASGVQSAYRIPYRNPTRHTRSRVRAARYFEGRAFRAATLVVTKSEWAAGSLRRDYGLTDDKVRVIPFGIVIPPRVERCAPPGLPEVTFTGTGLDRKGGLVLLEAFDRHLRDRAVLNLITYDEVDPRPGVNVYNDLRPGDPRLPSILARTAVFAFPSTIDTFGYAVLEAMAAGIPVVATPEGAMPEIVVHGETGILTPANAEAIAAAILGLLDDEATRARMGDAGRRRLEQKFDARVTTDALLAVMDEAVARFERT